jgi:zinc protease
MSISLPSPETIHRIQLPNGIVILVYENPNSPSVVIGGSLWAGSLSETPEQAGLSSFTAGMIMRGTETRTFGQINETLESAGAQLGFHSGVHTTGFGGKALAEDLGLLLEILADSLRHPTFPSVETETYRGQVLTALQRRAYDTRSRARLAFDALLYPDHPYGRSVQGYEETVSGLTRETLAQFYQDHYSPEGMVIAVVGAVGGSRSAPPDAVVEQVQAALGDWFTPGVTPNRSIPPAVRLNERRQQTVPMPGKTQSDLVMGWPGLARNDPDYWKARMANTVLGMFGMGGRLGDNVRDAQGLAYYVYSQMEAGQGAGPWLATAGVNPANVGRASDAILYEVRRLRDERLNADELADSQSFLTGSMPLRLETNEGIGSTLLEMERYNLGLDYLLRYADLVNAVTVEDAREMAQKCLNPDVYAMVVAGPEG